MDKKKEKAMSMSLKYLGYKMRTGKEIKEYLLRKKISEEDILYTLEKLIEFKYINDDEYAEFWIRDRYNFSGHGPYRIKRDLQLKGISGDIIDEKVNNFFDEEKIINKIHELYYKKNSENQKLSDKQLLSLCNFLLRRGFPGNLIKKVIFNLNKNNE